MIRSRPLAVPYERVIRVISWIASLRPLVANTNGAPQKLIQAKQKGSQ